MTNGLEKAKKLTKAQIENLEYVRAYGRAKPRSPSGAWCRRAGLVDWVWDGNDHMRANIIGETLTDAGIAALQSIDTGGGGA